MIKLAELRNTYRGRPAAILGGGPSLPSDYERLPPDSVIIAVNEHPYYAGVHDPDFLVFMDDPIHNPLLWGVVKELSGGLRVTHSLKYTDVHMGGVDYWNGPGSGIVACWLGLWLGCDPVLLCGMDLYQGPVKYCHRDELYKNRPVYNITLEEHLNRWKAGFRRNVQGIERVRAMSGPLGDVFGLYCGNSML